MTERVQDRRGKPRIEADIDAKISSSDGVLEARVRNMSLSGLLLVTDRPVPEMTILAMRLALPAAPERRSPAYAFELTGAVVRCEECVDEEGRYELAVFLTDMPRETRSALQSFVQERLGRGDD